MRLGKNLAAEHINMRLQNPRAIQKYVRYVGMYVTLGCLQTQLTDQPKSKADT